MSHYGTIRSALDKIAETHLEEVVAHNLRVRTLERQLAAMTRERDRYKGRVAEYRAQAASYRRDLIAARRVNRNDAP